MAGPIQIGDALRLAELAWTVWEYGWAHEYNAGENYRAFGADVHTLHRSLVRVEGAIKRAQNSLQAHGAHNNDTLIEDMDLFSDIVGDYNRTLSDCLQLIDDNRRYAHTTGPMLNIDWNLNVMPQVEHLRGRLQMHNVRIQHFLKPFEIDLINNFHGSLARRMMSMHNDVLRIGRDIGALLADKFPEVAKAIQMREEQSISTIEIPDLLSYKLDSEFRCHGLPQAPDLQDMTDCFLVHFNRSTALLPYSPRDERTCPPVSQYLELLKCQVLMKNIKTSPEIEQPRRMSYWPGYVRALEENLSHECARFHEELSPPDVSFVNDEALSIWTTVQRQVQAPALDSGPPHEPLLSLSLAPGDDTMTWRTMQLERQVGSEYRYRIIEKWGNARQPRPEGPHVVHFDTRTAILNPIYADPVGDDGRLPPLEIVLEHSHRAFRYVFLDLKSLLQFQRALTGFQVAEAYMQSHASVVFVRPRREDYFEEYATLQLWIPTSAQVRSQSGKTPDYRSLSSGSPPSAHATLGHSSRADSVSSNQSGFTSSTSHSSLGFDDSMSIAVRLGGSAATTDHGTIRTMPRKPLLVLFTRNPETSRRSIIAIAIDGETKPNAERCKCQSEQGEKHCPVTALEQGRGATSTLQARRITHPDRWNLLSFPARASVWEELLRVSILFPTVEDRRRFSGSHCTCRLVFEADVDRCLQQGHYGLMGAVRTLYRRQMIMRQGYSDARPAITSTK